MSQKKDTEEPQELDSPMVRLLDPRSPLLKLFNAGAHSSTSPFL